MNELTAAHYAAVEEYVKSLTRAKQDELYANVRQLMPQLDAERSEGDYAWLKAFILADVETLEKWVKNNADKLDFEIFRDLYIGQFAQKDKGVNMDGTYNAYALLRLMDIHVCPYCDDEYIDIINTAQGLRRTSEFDHFYPKSKYPALAMCFYNLIPSGKSCNQVMNKFPIEANPYHEDIESWSRFKSLIPLGSNLASLNLEDFQVELISNGRMVQNDKTLGINERYGHRKAEIQRILIANQAFDDEHCAELIRLGVPEDVITQMKIAALGNHYPLQRGISLHQKLRYDLTGY